MTISKEAIEAAVEEIRKVRKTPVWDRWTDHDAIEAVLEAALPFLSTLPIAVEGKVEPRVQHKKRGTEYAVVTTSARLQASGKLEDNEVMVVYRGEDGQIWCRPEYEFSDGRFEYILSSPGKDGGQGRILPDNEDFRQGYSVGYADAYGDVSDLKAKLTALKGAHSPQSASTALVERLTKALSAVNTWAEQRCPCRNEEPNPCPLCGADANKSGDICLSAENTFPRYLLTLIRDALSSARKDGHNANS